MPTTTQFIKAKNDLDLINRLVAQAEMLGVESAQQWVQSHLSLLLSEVVESGQTIADVYSYAREVRDTYIEATPEPPGQNLGAVTDAHMTTAIQAILPVQPTAE